MYRSGQQGYPPRTPVGTCVTRSGAGNVAPHSTGKEKSNSSTVFRERDASPSGGALDAGPPRNYHQPWATSKRVAEYQGAPE